LNKPRRDQLQPFFDKIADQLPGWKADLLTKPGKRILVQFALTGMLIYLAMAIDLPAWGLKAVDKIRRSFYWQGRKKARGGHCQVAWGKVCKPRELETEHFKLERAWLGAENEMVMQIPMKAQSFFVVAMQTDIGNGDNILFWTDRWLNGKRIADIAPRLLATIPKRRINKCTVQEGLDGNKWISDIRGALTVGVITKYLHLWNILTEVQLLQGVEDSHFWRFATNGQFTVKSANESFFRGSVEFEHYERVWKMWAPAKCRYFIWLVANRKCWTADRLAREGMDHPEKCPLCDQEQEIIDHLLVSCVFCKAILV
jgi:hypothetical protein